MKKIVILSVLIFSFGCSSISYVNKKELKEIEIKDIFLLKSINQYLKTNKQDKSLVVIITKDIINSKSVKYINHILSLSKLYTNPLSSYAIHNNNIILIYSKKDGYVDPRKYQKSFISKMKNLLDNDWSLTVGYNGALEFTGKQILNHSTPWKLAKGKIDSSKNYKFNRSKFLYNKIFFDFGDYYNLDSLRIVYPDGADMLP
jgi:hypothetical protein